MLLTLLMAAASCGGETARHADSVGAQNGAARLTLESAIGEGSINSAEYQFSNIIEVLVTPDGRVWIVDGQPALGLDRLPKVRQYDRAGKFLRQVAGEGIGPGEYQTPYALAVLRDGRVALRDYSFADRITLYTADGMHDMTLLLGGRVTWPHGGREPLQVDTSGIIWIPASGGRPGPSRPSPVFLRIRDDGSLIDTVPFPTAPVPERDSIPSLVRATAGGGRSVRGFSLPFQPHGIWAWSPAGEFAVARTDRYRVEIIPGPPLPGAPSPDRGPKVIASRDIPTVKVSDEQRSAEHAKILADMTAMGASGVQVPPIPSHKPPISWFTFSHDGRLLVYPSVPSRVVNGEWSETANVVDVFDVRGTFTGRIELPESFRMYGMRGEMLWGVFTGQDGVQSVRLYKVAW